MELETEESEISIHIDKRRYQQVSTLSTKSSLTSDKAKVADASTWLSIPCLYHSNISTSLGRAVVRAPYAGLLSVAPYWNGSVFGVVFAAKCRI